MSTLDGQAVFASGPSEFILGGWQRKLVWRELPGLNGGQAIDLGAGGRTLRQTGRLQAGNAEGIQTQVETIRGFQDGVTHTLIDNHGLTHPNVLLTSFELTSPIAAGDGFWADYRAEYLQLP